MYFENGISLHHFRQASNSFLTSKLHCPFRLQNDRRLVD
jgi:hypothetical protein